MTVDITDGIREDQDEDEEEEEEEDCSFLELSVVTTVLEEEVTGEEGVEILLIFLLGLNNSRR